MSLLLAATALRADVSVFANGRVQLPVVVAAEAAPEEIAAAEELARVLGVMSGLEWPVRTESVGDRSGAGFYVGRTREAAGRLKPLRVSTDLLRPTPGEIGPDGFRILTLGERVFLEGATLEATANAVSWLLQREGGVRWYAPGPLGEVIPRRTEWTLPELRVVREPAYVSREITGSGGEAWRTWCRRNGLRGRIEYSHNLTNVFPPELGASHPEWFPLVQGRRVIPATKADFNWQPDLTRPGVVERSVQEAEAAFAREHARASFSLGMNDSVRFDQGADTRAAVEPLRHFRGMPDYSPLVFGYMNRAAEQLAGTRTDKYLGCLAYFWCENVPAFPVHEQVVPYVTTDRTQFYDSDYRAADYELMSRWGRSGVRAFGLWEYGYGNAYVVPRVPHAMLAEAVREGWWRGARGYIADTGPHAGFDSFKVWMLAQLLWEPERTTAELEEDFFNGWYGPAAEPMRRFFARCEAQWMAQAGSPWWIKYYRQQDQPLLFPPEVCRELRELLTAAEAEAAARSAECGLRSADCGKGNWGRLAVVRTPLGRPACSHALLPAGACKHADLRQKTEAVRTQGPTLPLASHPSLPHSLTPYAARIALTSRAFAVTEAAVEFDRIRRALGAHDGSLSAPELVVQLRELQQARAALDQAAKSAAEGGRRRAEDGGQRTEDGLSPMALGDVAFLLRNDPVPRLLAALGRREAAAPLAVLAELQTAGDLPPDSAVIVPAHWRDLAAACADGRLARLQSRLPNGDFSRGTWRMEPRFLYPKWGELPADWEVRGIATETGRVALVARAEEGGALISRLMQHQAGEAGCVPAGTQAVRIEGAWETMLSTILPATPGQLHVLEAQLRGHSSPGNDASLFLVFMTADGRTTGEYRTQTLPKGASEWRTLLLAAAAPADAAWVSVGVAALRQPAGDWLEVAEVSLREVSCDAKPL